MVADFETAGNDQTATGQDRALVALIRRYFLNRVDRLAFAPSWGRDTCPAEINGDLEDLLSAHVRPDSSPVNIRWRTIAGKSGTDRVRARFGTYSPDLDGRTRFTCVDCDGGGRHARPLADPLGVALRILDACKRLGLTAYLEKSGGGKGWHVWIFFTVPVSAAKVRKLLLAILPKDALLTDGSFANASSNEGLELFPKQDRLKNGDGLGNQVWLPFWSGAKDGGKLFYRIGEDGQFQSYLPHTFETVTEEDVDNALSVVTGRPTIIELVNKYVGKAAGKRNRTGFDLACQLRDNRYPRAEAEAVLKKYQVIVSKRFPGDHAYELSEAAASFEQAYAEDPREPWTQHADEDGGKANNGDTADSAAASSVPESLPPIANAKKVKRQVIPYPMAEIVQNIRKWLRDWPRRVGDALFVPADDGGISWLESSSSLFGYLASKTAPVRYYRGVGCATKDETFAEVRRTAHSYEAVETLPHHPPMAGHYYACTIPTPGDGRTLKQLVGRFNPSTDTDSDLIEAAIVTAVVWGGRGGARPAFVITCDAGRGTGKTTFVKITAYLAGGAVELSANETAEVVKQRLLSPDGLTKRVALLDNVKSLRFSWADLEALITSPVISGKRLYVGEATRPNTISYFVTLNGACLAADMAQRSVIIKLDKPEHSGGWEEATYAFIDANRPALIGDCLGFFLREPAELKHFSRWGAWERDILSRLPDPEEAQRLILERQGDADVEQEEHEVIEEYFRQQLTQLEYEADEDAVFIPSSVAVDWFNAATNLKQNTIAVSRILGQAADEGKLRRISRNKCKTYGRGFVWRGEKATPQNKILTDIMEQIDAKQRNPFTKQAHGY
jgi:hypothetical protein